MSNCPKCGSTVVYEGLSTVECSGVDCENGSKKKEPWYESHLRYLFSLKAEMDAEPELPNPWGKPFPRRVVTYDTSGSVSKETMEAFVKHIRRNDVP